MPTTTIPSTAPGLEQIRKNAEQLLDRLLADRADIERRLEESGRPDPVRLVTGRSAIDSTINSTQRMLAMLERLEHADPVWRATNGRAPRRSAPQIETVRSNHHAGAI